MRHLLVVSHSPSPNTSAMTRAVVRGASHKDLTNIKVSVSPPLETGPDAVLNADGIILGTSENFGYMSGAMKDFFDRIYYPCLEETQSLPFALFIRAGSDGLGAKTSIERIIKGLAWKPVQETLICCGDWQEAFLGQCEEMGLTMAAGLDAGIF